MKRFSKKLKVGLRLNLSENTPEKELFVKKLPDKLFKFERVKSNRKHLSLLERF